MKTFINAPEGREIKRLNLSPLEEASASETASGICSTLESVTLSLGCGSSEQSSFMETLCQVANSILSGLGCDPVEPPSKKKEELECEVDSDCDDLEVCNNDNECEPDESDCRVKEELCSSHEYCNEETGSCENDEEHCYFTGCQGHETCEQESGECECLEGRCNENEDCIWEEEEDICRISEHICIECEVTNDCETGYYCKPSTSSCEQCLPEMAACDYNYECCEGMSCNANECEYN